MTTTGWRCAVCGATVDNAVPFPWRCPNATGADPYHVLHPAGRHDPDAEPSPAAVGDLEHANPFVRYAPRMAWWDYATRNGLSADECDALVAEIAEPFRITPFERSAHLSGALGCDVWVKDETGNVAGSHKARHLAGILLRLRAAERLGLLEPRPPLAIASCGNAALAAATLAARVDWPLDVYVPTWMDDHFGQLLVDLGATVHRCERRRDDPPGDPAMLRFREARAAGSVPFTVQGPENAVCLDAGRTIGWEIGEQSAANGARLDRIFVQVGGGALAGCLGWGLGPRIRLDTVQAAGCAPLADAWERCTEVAQPARYWSQIMRPWPDPSSVADGIIDDETYDWLADLDVMTVSGGRPLVAPEELVVRAHELATAAGYRVSPTGSAGLAGALLVAARLHPSQRIALVMSGVAR